MTDEDAWAIWITLSELEFPETFRRGLQFALFRTYGIPTISRLLVKTGQLSSPSTVVKRYSDTEALLLEIFAFPPSHPRTIEALSRLNYIHGIYRQSGQILDDDMLYTLSLFAIEPIKWIERIEWRSVSSLERCAIGTFMKSIGDAMEISYDKLPGSKAGFKDGLQWLEEIWAWTEDYERRAMVPNEANRITADQTVNILLWNIPDRMKPAAKHLVSSLMDDRLRDAMMYERPPPVYPRVLNMFVSIRRLLLRYLALPRPTFMRVRPVSEKSDKHGRYFLRYYDAQPYYVKPTFVNRWLHPKAWLNRIMGLPIPSHNGPFSPQGYLVGDIGPERFLGRGARQAKVTKERLQKQRTGGCPFAGATI